MSSGRADRLGMVASGLCAVHCVAGALLAGVSATGLLLADPRVELGFVAVAMVVAAAALSMGFRRHRKVAPPLLGALGIAVIAIGRALRLDNEIAEAAWSVSGAALLISAHVVNLRALQRNAVCCGGS